MSNPINERFKMNPGSKEVDTPGTFKNDAAVANMGVPTNYGTPSPPLNNLDDPDKKETRQEKGDRVYKAAMEKARKQKANLEARRNAPKKRSLLPNITMGTGTRYTTLNEG